MAMRRKSSAQNLLTSFKATLPSSSSPPSSSPMSAPVSSSIISLSFASSPPAPSALPREWDVQSLHSDSLSATTILTNNASTSTVNTSTTAPVPVPVVPQGTSAEYLRDLVQKRIVTLTYIRQVHQGRCHWFHTLLISRADLDREFSNTNPDVRKRAYRFAVLGMSLSSLLDIHQPQDLLRSLMNTINEYDSSEGDKLKMRASKRLFRPRTSRRIAGGSFTEYAGPYIDVAADPSYLVFPHIPFPLDYHQALISLLDVISEVYNKISKILGPSPFAQPSQHMMMGPLGLLTPLPGVSYLFSPQDANQPSCDTTPSMLDMNVAGNNSLWHIANPGGAFTVHHGSAGSQTGNTWSASLGEMVLKIDGKIKKITSTLLKELDTFARNGIKDELASLNPQLSFSTSSSGTVGVPVKSFHEEAA